MAMKNEIKKGTHALQTLLKRMPLEERKMSKEMVEFYYNQFKKMRDKYGSNDMTYNVHHDIDEALKFAREKSNCKKGCSACCHQQVSITEDEGNLIIEYLRQHEEIKPNWERAVKQVGIGIDGYIANKDSACMFLSEDDGLCTVYECRPIACRSHLVQSDPKFCDMETGTQSIQKLSNHHAEIKISAFVNLSDDVILPEFMVKMRSVIDV